MLYDAMGNRTSVSVDDFESGTQLAVGYAYTPQGRKTLMTLPSGRRIDYRYSPSGRLENVRVGYEAELNFVFEADGSLRSVFGPVDAGGSWLSRSYVYDERRRLEYSTANIGSLGDWVFGYSYDDRNLITEYTDNHRNVDLGYSYDVLGRLHTATGHEEGTYTYEYHRNSSLDTVSLDGQVYTYNYTSASKAQLSSIGGPNAQYSYEADSVGRRCTVAWEDASGGGRAQYQWAFGGKIGQFSVSGRDQGTIEYDENGQLVRRAGGEGGTTYVGKVCESGPNGLTERVSLPGLMLIFAEGEEPRVSLSDGRHNVMLLTSTGDVLEARTYRPYGAPIAPGQPPPRQGEGLLFGFQGQREDVIPGLVMFQARYYDPTSRMFLSPDPLRMVGVQDVFEHGKLQPYIFGAASPISFADLGGLKPVPHKECRSYKIGGVSATKRIEIALKRIRRDFRTSSYRRLDRGQRAAIAKVRRLLGAKRTLPIRCTRFDEIPAMREAKGAFGARVVGDHEIHVDPLQHAGSPEHAFSDTIVHELLHIAGYTHADEDGKLTKEIINEVARGALLKVSQFFSELADRFSQKYGSALQAGGGGSGSPGVSAWTPPPAQQSPKSTGK